MRPPEFTGGNIQDGTNNGLVPGRFNEAAGIHRRKPTSQPVATSSLPSRFNEAAGIHRRKPGRRPDGDVERLVASMRPPEFTGGNATFHAANHAQHRGFNEAAGIHRRKRYRPLAFVKMTALLQ